MGGGGDGAIEFELQTAPYCFRGTGMLENTITGGRGEEEKERAQGCNLGRVCPILQARAIPVHTRPTQRRNTQAYDAKTIGGDPYSPPMNAAITVQSTSVRLIMAQTICVATVGMEWANFLQLRTPLGCMLKVRSVSGRRRRQHWGFYNQLA